MATKNAPTKAPDAEDTFRAEFEAQAHIRRLQDQLATDQALQNLAYQYPAVGEIMAKLKAAQARIAELEAAQG